MRRGVWWVITNPPAAICDDLVKLCGALTFPLMQVSIKSSYQYRDGDEVVIASTGTPTCPVNMMTRDFDMARLTVQSSEVFRGIVHTSEGEKLRKSGGLAKSASENYCWQRQASWVGTLSCLVCTVSRLVVLPWQVMPESLIDCLSDMVAGSQRLFKQHGRWKSETAKDGYIKDAVDKYLDMSKHSGL